MEMNYLEKIGRKQTILISISILLVSLHAIYFYNSVFRETNTQKLLQQIIRFLFTVGLLILVYKGKKWARIVLVILFSIALLGAFFGLFFTQQTMINKIPLIVMIFVYSVSIFHFGLSKSFKAFFLYQNRKKDLF
ncbi:hypothetical protein D3C87_204990 [compost metagenome]